MKQNKYFIIFFFSKHAVIAGLGKFYIFHYALGIQGIRNLFVRERFGDSAVVCWGIENEGAFYWAATGAGTFAPSFWWFIST